MSCSRCHRPLTPYTFNGIPYAYCLPAQGGCGFGRKETADLFEQAGIVVARRPRDLFEWAGIAVESLGAGPAGR